MTSVRLQSRDGKLTQLSLPIGNAPEETFPLKKIKAHEVRRYLLPGLSLNDIHKAAV